MSKLIAELLKEHGGLFQAITAENLELSQKAFEKVQAEFISGDSTWDELLEKARVLDKLNKKVAQEEEEVLIRKEELKIPQVDFLGEK